MNKMNEQLNKPYPTPHKKTYYYDMAITCTFDQIFCLLKCNCLNLIKFPII